MYKKIDDNISPSNSVFILENVPNSYVKIYSDIFIK